jgi:hypothetical protein
VFQAFHLMDELTVVENVELPALLAGRSPRAARRRATRLLERVGLRAWLRRGGDRHRGEQGRPGDVLQADLTDYGQAVEALAGVITCPRRRRRPDKDNVLITSGRGDV